MFKKLGSEGRLYGGVSLAPWAALLPGYILGGRRGHRQRGSLRVLNFIFFPSFGGKAGQQKLITHSWIYPSAHVLVKRKKAKTLVYKDP